MAPQPLGERCVLRSPKQAAWVRSVLTLGLPVTHVVASRRASPRRLPDGRSPWRSAKGASDHSGRRVKRKRGGKEGGNAEKRTHEALVRRDRRHFLQGRRASWALPVLEKQDPRFIDAKGNKIPAPTVNHPSTKKFQRAASSVVITQE